MSSGENSSLLGISSNSWGAFSKSFELLHATSLPAGTEGFRAPSRSFSDWSLGDGGDKTRRPLWELGFFRPTAMDASELDSTQAQIADLHAELDIERIARRKLTKELSDERRARKSAEHACDGLAREMVGMRSEFEDERKMLKMCEVLREAKGSNSERNRKSLCRA